MKGGSSECVNGRVRMRSHGGGLLRDGRNQKFKLNESMIATCRLLLATPPAFSTSLKMSTSHHFILFYLVPIVRNKELYGMCKYH